MAYDVVVLTCSHAGGPFNDDWKMMTLDRCWTWEGLTSLCEIASKARLQFNQPLLDISILNQMEWKRAISGLSEMCLVIRNQFQVNALDQIRIIFVVRIQRIIMRRRPNSIGNMPLSKDIRFTAWRTYERISVGRTICSSAICLLSWKHESGCSNRQFVSFHHPRNKWTSGPPSSSFFPPPSSRPTKPLSWIRWDLREPSRCLPADQDQTWQTTQVYHPTTGWLFGG